MASPADPPSARLERIETATREFESGAGHASVEFALFGATQVNVSSVRYGLEWTTSVREGEDLVVYPKRVRFGPRDGRSEYFIEGVSLIPPDSDGTASARPAASGGTRFTLTNPAEGLGCTMVLDLWGGTEEVASGDSVEFGAVLDGLVARAGGLPGRVLEAFSVETAATVTYRERPR